MLSGVLFTQSLVLLVLPGYIPQMAKLIIWGLRILPNGLAGDMHVVGVHVVFMLQLKEQQD